MYLISEGLQYIIKEYIKKNLEKGFIKRLNKESKAFIVLASVFLIDKKNREARIVIDY